MAENIEAVKLHFVIMLPGMHPLEITDTITIVATPLHHQARMN